MVTTTCASLQDGKKSRSSNVSIDSLSAEKVHQTMYNDRPRSCAHSSYTTDEGNSTSRARGSYHLYSNIVQGY